MALCVQSESPEHRQHRLNQMKEYARVNKDAIAARRGAKYRADAEDVKSKAKVYREENRGKVREQRREYREKNKGKLRTVNALWREANPDYGKTLVAAWRTADPERCKASAARYREQNPEKIAVKNKAWRDKNHEQVLASYRDKYRRNTARYIAHAHNRRARELTATPKWDVELTEFTLLEAADLAHIRKATTGVNWHVDHIVPLKGKKVCGLHVWNNFQLLTESENRKKGCSFNQGD